MLFIAVPRESTSPINVLEQTIRDSDLANIEIGKDYGLPIIDNKLETKNARDKIWKVKTSSQQYNQEPTTRFDYPINTHDTNVNTNATPKD